MVAGIKDCALKGTSRVFIRAISCSFEETRNYENEWTCVPLILPPSKGVKMYPSLSSIFSKNSKKVHARLRKREKKKNARIRERICVRYPGEEFLPAACSRGSVVRRERQDEDDLRPFNEMRSRGSLRIRRRIGKNRGFVTCRVREWKGKNYNRFLCIRTFFLLSENLKIVFFNYWRKDRWKRFESEKILFRDIRYGRLSEDGSFELLFYLDRVKIVNWWVKKWVNRYE